MRCLQALNTKLVSWIILARRWPVSWALPICSVFASTVTLDQWRFGLSQLRVTHWRPRHSRDANLSCVYDSAPHDSPKPRTLIIPPTLVDPNPDVPAGVVTWVRNLHAAGSTLVSLCTGVFILAQTGLVDGRSVATHQICAESLAKRFPRIVVDVNRRIIDYGDIVTAGGFLSWVDMGLFLVERILGRATRAKTARFVLSNAAGEARYFTGFAPPQIHGDKAVLKAQEWMHMRDGSPLRRWRPLPGWNSGLCCGGSRVQPA
jgi:transcriptional regulator GlxA family with amidase domain